MRRAARVDENQKAVVDGLRRIGAEVTPLHRVGQGVSDLLVSFRQKWFVFEVKNPLKPKADQKLTEDEKKWIGKQNAPVYIVFTPQDAIDIATRIP